MNRTTVGVFDTSTQASQAVQELLNSGISRDDVSVIAQDGRTKEVGDISDTTSDRSSIGESAGVGAVSGGVLGGTLGLLVGIGALAIPGIGPVLAVGPLAAALGSAGAGALVGAGVGAASGGILGALIGAGIPEDDAHVYAESVRRGGTLVSVTTDDQSSTLVSNILRRYGAADINALGAAWREQGWDGKSMAADTTMRDWQKSSKAGSATGTAAGAATGAAIGSAGGPVGTVVGRVAGAAVGAATGAAGDVAGEHADDEMDDEERRRRANQRTTY